MAMFVGRYADRSVAWTMDVGDETEIATSSFEAERDLFGRTPKGRQDWSHRRGEPRGLILAWVVYLMLASAMTFGGAMIGGRFSMEAYGAGVSRLMVILAAGIAVLWPVMRLSQSTPEERGPRSLLIDMLVLLIPAQILIWPQPLMAGWPVDVSATVAGLFVGWAIVSGATVLIGWSGGSVGRAFATAAILVVTVLPLVLAWYDRGSNSIAWLSPLGSVWLVTADRTWLGEPVRLLAPMGPRVVGWLVVAGLLLWAASLAVYTKRASA